MKNEKRWITASGVCGILFFLIANFANVFHGLNVTAGFLQLAVNAFVFIVWIQIFWSAQGFKRFISFFGVVGPIITAVTTIYRVLIPWFLN